MISNYEKTKNNMAAAFLKYDQKEMIRKFSLEHDEKYIFIRFLEREYRIDRANGKVTWLNPILREESAGFNETMTIYDLLCGSKEGCRLAGEWVNVASLAPVKGGSLKKKCDFFPNAGECFEGKTEALARACEALGGRKLEKGDVAYELDMFTFLPIVLRFWDSDEDFPASMQILVDKNILDYIHYETLMYAISHLLDRLEADVG